MEAKELFKKAKKICNKFTGSCKACPLNGWCVKGIFAINAMEVEGLEFVIEMEKS